MLNRFARALFTRIFTPVARFLLRLGISPDGVPRTCARRTSSRAASC